MKPFVFIIDAVEWSEFFKRNDRDFGGLVFVVIIFILIVVVLIISIVLVFVLHCSGLAFSPL